MTNMLPGGCLCGSVRFECDQEQLFGGTVCHCRDCQYICGGGPAIVIAGPESAVNILQGELKSFSVKGSSGSDVTRLFCGECGTPIFSELAVAPGVKVIKVGAFDDPSFFSPEMTVWTSSAQPFALIDSELPQFPKVPG